MTDYRGVDQTAVCQSLSAAHDFLRQIGLGPATTAKLDEWLNGKDALNKISAATDSKSMAQAMHDTGSSNIFLRYGELLRYHALLDTDGVGKKVYTDLCKWGGLSSKMTTSYGAVDQEQDVYLITEYTKNAQGQQQVAPLSYGTRLGNFMDGVKTRNPDIAAELEAQVQSLVEKAYARDDKGLAHEVLQSTLRQRNILKQGMFYVSGLSQDVQNLDVPQVFKRYGIAVDSSKYATNDQAEEAKYDLAEQAHDVLGEFYDTDEVQMAAVGTITNDGKQSGLVFISTRRAAEALADHFNQQQKVIDQAGHQVLPSANKGKSSAPSAPQP